MVPNTAMGITFRIGSTAAGDRIYRDKDSRAIVWDTSKVTVEQMKAVLFLEGKRIQKEKEDDE